MIDYFKKKEITERAEDEILFEYVMEEMEKTEPIKGLWAKAIAHSEGNNDKAKSMYMQFRVQSIKDEFDAVRIIYNEMSKEKLFDTIKNGFKEQHQQFEIKKEEEIQKEENKYNKIGGWLILFAIFLILGVINNIKATSEFFNNDFAEYLTLVYLNNDLEIASNIDKLFYLHAFAVFFVLLFALSFFTKNYLTKKLAITYFIAKFIIVPLSIYLSLKTFPDQGIAKEEILLLFSLFWVIILLLYFIFSKRVKKTFKNDNDTSTGYIFIIPIAIVVILLFSYNSHIHEISSPYNLQNKAVEIADKSFEEKDYETAIKWYQNAVERGDGSSKFRLAYSYSTIKNYDKAIKYYLEYIEKEKYEGAMRNLALVYERKKESKNAQKWFKQAFDIYIEKARDGDKEAMKWLVLMYKYGEGIKKDLKKSNYWDKKQND
ncbi:MAG: hypothetical protein COB17_11510 [Sulfurimonas sp.]|nr:MAG: hypothetical protein COB17_11510 [Sulfurimonas sp.]